MSRPHTLVLPSAAPLAPYLRTDANLGSSPHDFRNAQNRLVLRLLVCLHGWDSDGVRRVTIQAESQVVGGFALVLRVGVHDCVYSTVFGALSLISVIEDYSLDTNDGLRVL